MTRAWRSCLKACSIVAAFCLVEAGIAMSTAAAQPDASFVLPREQFLHQLDLTKPELAAVKAALDANDVPKAERAFIAYWRQRPLGSPFLTGWEALSRNPAYKNNRSEDALAGRFQDGYSVYEAPPTGLDWHGCPLSCVTRMPLLIAPRGSYHHTRDRKYLRFIVDHVLGYINAYPIADFVDNSSDKGWVNHTTVAKPWYWCMLPQRFGELSDTLPLIRTSPAVTDEELLTILHRLYQEGGYQAREIKLWVDRRHNGGCAMIKGLAMAATVLQDFPQGQRWLDLCGELTAQYVREAFYPDGMCIELTTAYSASVANQMQSMIAGLTNRPAIQALKPRVREMITCLVALSDPTGWLPSFGDLYAGKVHSCVNPAVAAWADLPWAPAVLGKATEPLPPFTVWPQPGQEAWSGYYTMRSDWTPQARFLAMDCGPWGATHQHGDRLSFVVTALGAKFIIDPSGTRYASNTPDSFISRQCSGFLHNTITVDGVDEFRGDIPLESKAPLTNRWEHGDRYSLLVGDYSFAPVKPVKWERRMLFVDKTYWLLQDVLTGELPEAAIEQNFQFEADTQIEFKDGVTLATAPNGARLALAPLEGGLTPKLTLGDKKPQVSYWPDGKPKTVLFREDGRDQAHGRGWTGRSSDKLLPAPAVTYTGQVKFPAMITVAIVPLEAGQSLADLPQVTREGEVWTLPLAGGKLRFETKARECRVRAPVSVTGRRGQSLRKAIWLAVIPPSTTSTAPVTNEASSEARNRAALATSWGWPRRPRG